MKLEWAPSYEFEYAEGIYLAANRQFDGEEGFSMMPIDEEGFSDDGEYTHVLTSDGEPIEQEIMTEWGVIFQDGRLLRVGSGVLLPDGIYIGGNFDGSDFGMLVVENGAHDPDFYTHVFCDFGKPVKVPKPPKHVEVKEEDEDMDESGDDGWDE